MTAPLLAQHYLDTTRAGFGRLRAQAERALAQVDDEDLHHCPDPGSNNLAVIVQHVGGALRSRFTDFLTSDGEKPERDRNAEFEDAHGGREELMAAWRAGWERLEASLAALQPADLGRTVTIRGEAFTVVEALQRALGHVAEHTGQIVYLAKHLAGGAWRTLSIPKGDPGKHASYRLRPR